MSYQHIENLYKNQDILMQKECYALEKIHGTSAHITYKDAGVSFFAGGGKYENFVALFDKEGLEKRFAEIILGGETAIIYGESYGGKQQGMSGVYGKDSRFVAFEVKIGDLWLSVPKAEKIVLGLGLEFVSYKKIPCKMSAIDGERDALSIQAQRNGMGEHPREGIVLHPLEEMTKKNGERIIAKHKTEAYSETKTKREVSPEKLQLVKEAQAIAEEWVTPMRLQHVLSGSGIEARVESIGKVIPLMIEDVIREAKGEIVDSPDTRKEIGRQTALMIKRLAQSILVGVMK
ncbi:hypothetical protein LCGC14_2597070 [marine sediment metagenome]|uniref:RNA ligase domain-containing protein n=1 Tax=marine sediment metagenome TaxID=412755 RepID=A0A0F9A9X9_9ZZZZ